MATQEKVTPRQLELARKTLWHQNGEALRTMESARGWLEGAGLVPLYPHAQFQAPAPSFAEAVLGRPEQGWVPQVKRPVPVAASGAGGTGDEGVVDEDEEDFAGEAGDEDGDLNGTEEDIDEDTDEEGDPETDEDEDFEDDEDELAADGKGGLDGSDEAEEVDDDEETDGDEESDEAEDEPVSAEGDEAALAGDGNIPSDRETMLSDDDEFAEDEGDEIAEKDRIDAEGNPLPDHVRMTENASAAEPAPVPVNGFSPEERETVHRTLARLVEDGTVVPLNLLGSTTGEPDFLVPASAFSFVYTLRGDKNWKNEPATTGAMRVSPLAVKVYGILRERGAMPLHEITTELGQGITDSATLRALNELWAIQRVLPLPDPDGRPARWEIMSERYLRHMKAGANAGQPTALSALLSLYLAQTVAATTDEMEIFLSPLAARSRVRDVVHGLEATRQLEPLVVEGKTLLHVTGALPQLPGDDTASAPKFAQRSRYESDDRRAEFEQRRADEASRLARPGKYPVRRPAGAADERGGRSFASRPSRPAFGRGDRPASGGGDRPSFGRGDRPAFSRGDRPAGSRPPFQGSTGDRDRRPFQRRDGESTGNQPERGNFARPWDEERANRPVRVEGESGGRRPFVPRADGERKPFPPREGSERRPFSPRNEGERKPFVPRADGERRPFTPRGDGERRPFTPRGDGERRPFTPRGDGERSSFTPRGDGERRPFAPREGGERRPFTPRGDGERRPFTPRGDGERRPFTPRADGERRPFTPRGDGERRPFTPRGDGERRPFTPRGDGERRPFTPRADGERRPFVPREGSQDRPNRERFSGEPGEGRPSFQSGAHSGGPGGSKFGGSGFGRDRGGKGAPGKFGRPGGRPSFKGPGSGPARGGAPKRRPE